MLLKIYAGTLHSNCERVKKQLESEIEELKLDRLDKGKSTAMALSTLDGVSKLRRINELLWLLNSYNDWERETVQYYLQEEDLWILLPKSRITHKFVPSFENID